MKLMKFYLFKNIKPEECADRHFGKKR